MFCVALLVTTFAFLSDPVAASGNPSNNSEKADLAKFLEKLSEDYRNAGLDKVFLDLKEEWKKFMDSGKYNASECIQNDLQKFLKKLEENFCKGGIIKDEERLEEEWQNFTRDFGQNYPAEEIPMRKEVFRKNEESALEHNKLFLEGKSPYEMGINELAAMTDEEYHNRNDLKVENVTEPVNTCRPKRVARQAYPIQPTPFSFDRNYRLPSSVDWRKKGLVGPVQNQGQCGSCYSFSAIAALEGLHKRVKGTMVKLSEQNGVDCTWDLGNGGCGGGWMHRIFQFAQRYGIARSSDYPYTGVASRTCRLTQSKAIKFVDGFVFVPRGDEQALKYAVARYGPISIAIDANTRGFMLYKSGIFNDPQCTHQLNHAVLLVGYGTDPKRGDYWIIKNSWGTSWGMKGYAYMARNRGNACGIALHSSFAYKKMKR